MDANGNVEEPAQLQASNAGLSGILVNILCSHRLQHCRPFLNIMCKTLLLLVSQGMSFCYFCLTIRSILTRFPEPETKLANPETPALLLNLATSRTYALDLEEFCELTSVALAYLAGEQFQNRLLETSFFGLLVEAFSDSYTRFDIASADPEDAQQLKQLWNGFVQVCADISALPPFSAHHPVGSPVIQRLINWLSGPSSDSHLQTAACLCLGNLARSDDASTAIVKDVFPPLLAILTRAVPSLSTTNTPNSPPPSQLVHAVLSFLKNLAIPPANRPLLGSLLDPPLSILPHLWSTTDTQPQTQFAAVSLTRLLLAGSPPASANVRRVCAPLSSDPCSPARDRSNLHLLMALRARVDAEPTKLEASRAVTAVCRALHTSPVSQLLPAGWEGAPSGDSQTQLPTPSSATGEADVSSRRSNFYIAHGDIPLALVQLVTQTRFPALRSEVWFVLALMSRDSDGARVAMEVLASIEACRTLFEAITGRDMLDGHELLAAAGPADLQQLQQRGGERGASGETDPLGGLGLEPQQADPAHSASMAVADRENCLVLAAEVLRQYGQYVPLFKKNILEEALAEGGKQVLQERKQGEEGGGT